MNDSEEKIKQQMEFFDYIYPSISRRIDDLEKRVNRNWDNILMLNAERDQYREIIEQYKKKIQRIEQLLIEHGLINLLGKK